MERMKTFFKYLLILIGFFIVSTLIQILAFYTMYGSILDNGKVESKDGIILEISKIKATNVNGILDFKVTNNSQQNISEKYVKVDLINEQDLLATTKYIKISDLNNGESINYRATFQANNIESYNLSIVNEAPDNNSNVINVFGVDIDVNNLVMSVKDGVSKIPNFVFAIAGLFVTLQTGKLLWLVYILI